jgi:pyridoxal phosphate enzyme (YggS family)
MDTSTQSRLKEVLTERMRAVEERIHAACRCAGRSRAEVILVAVTKTISAEIAALLPQLGILDLGESRPQELWRKAAQLSKVAPPARWHQVGHLQRNKIEATLPLVHLIHSVDSVRLLNALDREATKQQRTAVVLLEVNVSREANKHGFSPQEIPGLAKPINDLKHVQVAGLMTMAALESDTQECRWTFAELRQLRDRCRPDFPPPHDLCQLSMGMTNDFEVAIEEGATLIRLGTVLFEGLA